MRFKMNLKSKTITGAKWSALSTLIIIGLGLAQMTFLARLISNAEFGLLSLAMVVIALADTISDFGISNSIIQKKSITNAELTTLYWLNVLIGLIVFMLVFSLSKLIAEGFKNEAIQPLVKMISFAFVIIPHGQQFRALIQKELLFTTIGIVETVSVITGFLVTVGLAYQHPFASSAIIGYLANSTIRTILFAYLGRKIYSPSIYFNINEVKSNLKFGAYLTADSLVNFINTNIATIIIARLLGAASAGGYNLAYNVAVVPPTKLNPIITRVLFPAFAKIQDENDKLKYNFFKLLSLVGLLNFPILLGLLIISNNFITLVFGDKWQFVTPILQILCIVGLLRSIGNPIGSLLMAKARVDISFKFNIFKTLLFIPFLIIGAHFAEAVGVALGFLFVQIINTILSYFILIKPILGSSYKEYLYSIWMPFKLTLPTVLVSYMVSYIALFGFSLITVLVLQVVAGIIVFAIVLLITKDPLVRELKNIIAVNPFLRKIFRVF